jgi:uncharacterized protein YdeI (YjbR/CyaY-like superfamily)
VPDDLAAGSWRNRRAAATFEGFPPSCRREHVEWITEATRRETRERRIVQAVEWTAEGESRSGKYRRDGR